ncbi:phosphate regulon sensor histidine kinase PhoR [Limnohabitans sp. JirII-31]|uniref:phosphate regulon sensor histidine kinase PhoR n=1 Tax=Limnohabitans sp. JirII-31 TaxID=1977908 RepID=UPI000C1DDD13|nr:phosphate regulon sensor histidine kinase PhoR [Limnohabitans sp. JirII-31]PIT77277.1 phosphate regulon sensor histidine kinase PhoR [Limnohabitans sp. JirII-31]
MFWRFFSLLFLLSFGAALGYFWGGAKTALTAWASLLSGALLAGLLWWLLDALRGLRVVSWLRQGDLDRAPQTIGLWGEVVDRTRRLLRERERALLASEQRLKDFLLAIQASPNGVMLLDDQTQIEWCNQTAAAQLGINTERDLMQRIGNLVRDPVFMAYMSTPEPCEPVVIAGRDDREGHPVRIFVQRHRYGEGKQLLITRDVTALEQAEAMRRDFVANVSHEIRTPLTVLSGFVETLQTLPLSAHEQQRYLALMATQAHRMQSLVEDLLTLSRLEGSPNPGYQSNLSVSQLLRFCQQEAQALSSLLDAQGTPQSLTFSADPSLSDAVLLGEPRELQSALSNLVSNAVRYTPAGGHIDVKAQVLPDASLRFAVQDTGPGIAAEHVPRLTERFYRVDRSRSRESGGTGLGLAIVKHVMQRHGGHLSIQSVQGQGSCFTLTLPPARWRQHAA